MAAKKTSKPKKGSDQLVRLNRNLHIVSLGVLFALAMALSFIVKATYFPVSLSYVTENQLLGEQKEALVPGERVFSELDVRWIAGSLVLLGLIYSILMVTRWAKSYQKAQDTRIYFWRWVYFALAGSLTIQLVNITIGVEDAVTIKLSESLIVFAAAFAWFSERQNQKSTKPIWSAYLLATFAAFLGLLPVLGLIGGTYLYGMVTLPWYTYSLAAVGIAAPLLVGLNLFWSLKSDNKKVNYAKVERNYILIALLIQTKIVTLLLLAFHNF